MNWYKSARKRYGSFRYDFDGIELMNPICFCSGTADVEFSIERDPGDRYEPPTVDVEVQPEVENITCVDVDDNLIKATPDMISQVEYSLKHGSESARVRERALDHEWS